LIYATEGHTDRCAQFGGKQKEIVLQQVFPAEFLCEKMVSRTTEKEQELRHHLAEVEKELLLDKWV
jgi:hypothetical protein